MLSQNIPLKQSFKFRWSRNKRVIRGLWIAFVLFDKSFAVYNKFEQVHSTLVDFVENF